MALRDLHVVFWAFPFQVNHEFDLLPLHEVLLGVCLQRKWDRLALEIYGHLEANVRLPDSLIIVPSLP